LTPTYKKEKNNENSTVSDHELATYNVHVQNVHVVIIN